MTEGIASSYVTSAQSADDRQQMFTEWRKRLSSDRQIQQSLQNSSEQQQNEQVNASEKTQTERPEQFLPNNFISAERQQPFLSEDRIPTDRPEPFLSNDTERPQPFLTQQADTTNAQSPLELQRDEEDTEEDSETVTFTFPKNNDTILAELRRNALHSTMTARDIAEEYDISYMKAMDIYKTLNEDTNGIAREFNLPDENATVSFLV